MSQSDVLLALRSLGRPATTTEIAAHIRRTMPRGSAYYVPGHLLRLELCGMVRRAGKAHGRFHANVQLWEAA